MKKMYLVVSHAVNDCSDCGVGTTAFNTREMAEKFFHEQVENEKSAIEDFGWVVGADTNEEFDAYEYDYYAQNHTHVEIRELKIN